MKLRPRVSPECCPHKRVRAFTRRCLACRETIGVMTLSQSGYSCCLRCRLYYLPETVRRRRAKHACLYVVSNKG
jgi:hypothetical protein